MKGYLKSFPILLISLLGFGCSDNDNAATTQPPEETIVQVKKYLALGDSYTIGQSVCETCRFPRQLADSLEYRVGDTVDFTVKVIATTGWTTTNLKAAISNDTSLSNNYDLVTLLIGVNNQYQHQPFSLYEQEFPELVTTAITLAQGEKSNVIVVSIPDYAYTPFGQGSPFSNISEQVAQYNAFAQDYCLAHDIVFVNITDITQQGLAQPALVASDGLHPSELAYSKFVERILPKAIEALE